MSFVLYTQILKQSVLKTCFPRNHLNKVFRVLLTSSHYTWQSVLSCIQNCTHITSVVFCGLTNNYTEQKKKGIILVMWPFSVLVQSRYMGYEILLTAIFHIGLCNKFRYQSSVKGLSRQWVEIQKVRAGRILTTRISISVDRRYLYSIPDRKSTKCWTNS